MKTTSITLILITIAIASSTSVVAIEHAGSDDKGLLVVVTFSNLVYDVQPLLCRGDRVEYIAPLGADPHEYQLTPDDKMLIEKADLIISTAHAPFELSVKRFVEEYGLKTPIIEIPLAPGITLLKNPMTGKYNYHMPIYDPRNYIIFIRYVAEILGRLRPSCRVEYLVHASEITGAVEGLVKIVERNKTLIAVGDKPFIQYSVSWLGIDIRYLLVREVGVPVSSEDLLRIEEAMKDREIDVAVVSSPPLDKVSRSLIGLAEKYGIPIIYVPVPFSQSSFVEKLENISIQYLNIMYKPGGQHPITGREEVETSSYTSLKVLAAIILVLSSLTSTVKYYRLKKRWFEWLEK